MITKFSGKIYLKRKKPPIYNSVHPAIKVLRNFLAARKRTQAIYVKVKNFVDLPGITRINNSNSKPDYSSDRRRSSEIAESIGGSLHMSSVIHRADRSRSRPPIAAIIRNIWVLRTALVIFGMALSGLLLLYSLLFVYTFVAFGNTTSYFPWMWHVMLTDYSSVQTLLYISLSISTVAYTSLAAILFLYVLPRLRISLRQLSIAT